MNREDRRVQETLSQVGSVSISPGFLGRAHKSWCCLEPFVLAVPHRAVLGLEVLQGTSWLLFFSICLWTCSSGGFTPVISSLVSVSTSPSSNKLPSLCLPCRFILAAVYYRWSVHASAAEGSSEQLLCIPFSTASTFCKPLSHPYSALSKLMQSNLFSLSS